MIECITILILIDSILGKIIISPDNTYAVIYLIECFATVCPILIPITWLLLTGLIMFGFMVAEDKEEERLPGVVEV